MPWETNPLVCVNYKDSWYVRAFDAALLITDGHTFISSGLIDSMLISSMSISPLAAGPCVLKSTKSVLFPVPLRNTPSPAGAFFR